LTISKRHRNESQEAEEETPQNSSLRSQSHTPDWPQVAMTKDTSAARDRVLKDFSSRNSLGIILYYALPTAGSSWARRGRNALRKG
jgi:hypothetical protein